MNFLNSPGLPYILLLAIPGVMAIVIYPLQSRRRLAFIVALLTCLADLLVWSQLSAQSSVVIFGQTLLFTPLNYFFLPIIIVASALCIIVGWLLYHGRNFASVILFVLSLSTTIFILDPTNEIIIAVLLTMASLSLVFAIVDQPVRATDLLSVLPLGSAVNYTVMMFISLVCYVIGGLFLHLYYLNPDNLFTVRIVTATLFLASATRMAVAPLHIWLPGLSEQAEVMATVVAIGILDTVAFVYLLDLLAHSPYEALLWEAVTTRQVVEAVSAISVIVGGLAAFAQRDLRRFVAYSLISDTGLIFFGLATLSADGVSGALLEVLHLVIIKILLFTCCGIIQYCTGTSNISSPRGLGRHLPITAIGFVAGGLSLIGLPPFGSATAKLLLYSAAARSSPWWLLLFIVGALLLIIAYTRVVQSLFFGAATNEVILREPRALVVLVLVLVFILLASGVYPQFTSNAIAEIVRGFNFVR